MNARWILLIALCTLAITTLSACGPRATATPLLLPVPEVKDQTSVFQIIATPLTRPLVSKAPATSTRAATPARPAATRTPTGPTPFPAELAPQATASAKACAHSSKLIPANYQLVLCDSFTPDLGFWPTGAVTGAYVTGTKTIADGKYQWDLTAKQNSIMRSYPDLPTLHDFYLTTEGQIVKGDVGAWYGVGFRWSLTAPFNHYLFEARADRRFRALLLNKDEYTTIMDWTYASALKSGAPNRLTVIGKGAHFDLYANEVRVAQFDDTTLTQGVAGLIVGLQSAGDHAIFEFDNFEVRAP